MQQVVDLQESQEFQDLGVALLSMSPDSLSAWAEEAAAMGIRTPVLSDQSNRVADMYGVMRWQMAGEPGHTFVLVDKDGMVQWVRDYGAPENGGLMYVPPAELVREMVKLLA
jgi:peroxiredoxin